MISSRLRLALFYGCVFIACGAGLLAITYLLVSQNGRTTVRAPGPPGTRTFPAGRLVDELNHVQQAADLHTLLTMSAIVLALMAALSGVLAWLFAGRVLRPLEMAFESQRRFVANASHELRTPLARLKTLLQVAMTDPDATPDSLRSAQARALAAEQQLEELIDALLALAHGDQAIERPEPVDLAAATRAALAARKREIERRKLRVDASLDPACAEGNRQLLDRVVSNLLDNAISHNTPGGWLEVTTSTPNGHAILSVANSGPVIPPRELDRLKQPFQRLATPRTSPGDGYGLGLPIIVAIVSSHGGNVRLEAPPEGGLHVQVGL
ncbi:MAG TPA: HAMP domain-containing sensor histidine kinase [Solirubrobacteraceae bacterium]|nr:HAMP domain-containing sensor histidine kinase [Solirubrobacteraceae bacterium]